MWDNFSWLDKEECVAVMDKKTSWGGRRFIFYKDLIFSALCGHLHKMISDIFKN